MAFTVVLVTVLMVTMANAGFSAWNDDNFPSWNPGAFASSFASTGFNIPRPVFPPGFPFNFNFPPMPPMPPILTPADIVAQNKPGFNGIAVSSQSTAIRGENGEIIRDGESTVVTNENGHVTVHKLGTGPGTVIITQSKNPPFPDIKPPQFKSHFKEMRMPKMDSSFKPFKPITFKPMPMLNPDELRDYVPEEDETFTGFHYHSSSYSNDINGVKDSGGSATEIENDNGRVKEKDVVFRQDPE